MKTSGLNYKPLRNEVLIEYIEEPDFDKRSGLYLPANRRRGGHHRGKALAIGPRVREVHVGDICLIRGSDAGTRLDKKQFIVSEDIILATLEE